MSLQEAQAGSETASAAGTPRPASSYLFGVSAVFCLALAALQLFFFAPLVSGGAAADFPAWHTFIEAPYRVDALSLTFGVAWALGSALVAMGLTTFGRDTSAWRRQGGNTWLFLCVLCLALVHMAYARSLLWLYGGWEVAGIAMWLALTPLVSGRRAWLILAIHLPGWALWTIALFYEAVFAPPTGGAAQPWHAPLVAAFALVCVARSGGWPFNAWARYASVSSGEAGSMLLGLYIAAGPYLLARGLVTAPWGNRTSWALALLGTVALVAAATSTLGKDRAARMIALQTACSAAAIIGLGLASGTPVAGAGALVLMLVGALLPITWFSRKWPWLPVAGGWTTLLGGSAGAWAIAQGALQLGYGLIAALLLPAAGLMALGVVRAHRGEGRLSGWIAPLSGALVLALAGVFPQGLIEWVVRPALGAMAGGVSAPRQLQSSWPLGLQALASGEVVGAALPATGMALAVVLAYAVLRWLSMLVRHFVPSPPAAITAVEEPDLSMDDILPGAEQAGSLLDPEALLARLTSRS